MSSILTSIDIDEERGAKWKKCPGCGVEFALSGLSTPYTLPSCGHAVCYVCIYGAKACMKPQNIKAISPKTKLYCAVCQEKSRVLQCVKNEALIGALSEYKKSQTKLIKCSNCHRHAPVELGRVCTTCAHKAIGFDVEQLSEEMVANARTVKVVDNLDLSRLSIGEDCVDIVQENAKDISTNVVRIIEELRRMALCSDCIVDHHGGHVEAKFCKLKNKLLTADLQVRFEPLLLSEGDRFLDAQKRHADVLKRARQSLLIACDTVRSKNGALEGDRSIDVIGCQMDDVIKTMRSAEEMMQRCTQRIELLSSGLRRQPIQKCTKGICIQFNKERLSVIGQLTNRYEVPEKKEEMENGSGDHVSLERRQSPENTPKFTVSPNTP